MVDIDKGRDFGAAARSLSEWLKKELAAAKVDVRDVTYSQGAGISNETILFSADIDDGATTTTRDLVLRVGPAPENQLCRDPMFTTQVRLLQTLRDRDLARVPDVLWYEPDPSWFGEPFFIMDRARGRVPLSSPLYNAEGWLYDATPAQRRTVWETALDEMIRIHRVPPDVVRFVPGGESASTAFEEVLELERVNYAWACEGVQHPAVDCLWTWLDEKRPPAPPEGLSWGDARIGNMMFGDDYRLVVVMDWEFVSLGGSVMDLGWWLLFDDIHSEYHQRLDGLGTRDETIERWEKGTGLSADHLLWYEIFASIRLSTVVIRSMNLAGVAAADDDGTRSAFTRHAYQKLGWDVS